MSAVAPPRCLLRVTHLSKSFPGLRALDDVSLEVRSGEVVAVLGHNGSGKSTLVKVLAGVHAPDPGATIEVRGDDGEPARGADAHAALHFIHQDLGLVAGLSTVENLDLGRAHGWRALAPAHTADETERARELVGRFGVDFDVRRPVAELSAAERTIVAIARALDGWNRPDNVLVLDEPTAALHGDEVARLLGAVRRAARGGAGIVFISHRLDEVVELADRVVVLRDGHVVADLEAGAYDHDALVRLIAGGEVARTARRTEQSAPGAAARASGVAAAESGRAAGCGAGGCGAGASTGASALRVRGIAGATVRGVDFDLHAGEVVGVSGLLGSGREHLAGLVYGALARDHGTVEVDGRPLPADGPRAAIAAGVAYVPADRHSAGAVMGLCARENVTLPRLRPLRRAFGRLDRGAERRDSREWLERVGLRPLEPERALALFSGGNQQKVVLAKWLRNAPRVLLLDEPTQGVDVGAKAAIHALLDAAARAGAAVLVSSSDTEELTLLCDRVMVLRDGVVAAELAGADLNDLQLVREGLGLAATSIGGTDV
jgi:ribose transport system ATP-binding protein